MARKEKLRLYFRGKDPSFQKAHPGAAVEKRAELENRLSILRKHNLALEKEHDHLMRIKHQTEEHVGHASRNKQCYMTMGYILDCDKKEKIFPSTNNAVQRSFLPFSPTLTHSRQRISQRYDDRCGYHHKYHKTHLQVKPPIPSSSSLSKRYSPYSISANKVSIFLIQKAGATLFSF
jgi:hypothetical protein